MTGKNRVHIIATGGTIASKPTSATATVGYAPSVFTVDDLLESVPGAHEAAELTAEQLMKVQSPHLTDQQLMTIGRRVQEVLDKDMADGVVVVMGTDTMEEVAYFLHLTIKSHCPVVVVGAMRPAGIISSDGPLNLLNAIRVAASPKARDMGVMVAMNDLIVCGRDVSKTSSWKVETFVGGYYGIIGSVQNGVVDFFYKSVRPYGYSSIFDLNLPEELPHVEIVPMYQGCGSAVFEAVCNLKPEAIIISGFGNGAINNDVLGYCREHREELPILVRSARAAVGGSFGDYGHFDDEIGTFPGGDMSPQKLRILMKLILTKTKDHDEIVRLVQEY